MKKYQKTGARRGGRGRVEKWRNLQNNIRTSLIVFIQVMHIFMPYSAQLYPREFPGTDPLDCPRNMKRPEYNLLIHYYFLLEIADTFIHLHVITWISIVYLLTFHFHLSYQSTVFTKVCGFSFLFTEILGKSYFNQYS